MSKGRLIVNADDLGLTEGHNRAIVEAHNQGIVTSASLLACGGAFEDAVEQVRSVPTLGIGVHLTLLEGVPVLPAIEVPDLIDERGRFGLSWVSLFWRLAIGWIRPEQVYCEWRAQIHKVITAGVSVTHLDSHKHIHMHPQLLEVILALADEFGIRKMRLSRPLHPVWSTKSILLWLLSIWVQRQTAQKGICTPDALLGLEASGQMTTTRLLTALSRPWQGTYELMTHPAYLNHTLKWLLKEGYQWIAEYQFEDEQIALCSPIVQERLREINVQRIHYGEL